MPDANWHVALDGKTWAALKNYLPELLPQIATRGTIFARMAPDQKTQLVEMLQSLDYIVAMCGDGANDCGVSTESALFTALFHCCTCSVI
jgi:magnesium-transporting ATPase (P-type)